MVGNMIESAINKAVYHINFLIDGVNKVIGIFDQEIPKIPEATIDWSNTFAIETEKIVENTEKQGEAIEETAQKVEDSFRREELALDKKADAMISTMTNLVCYNKLLTTELLGEQKKQQKKSKRFLQHQTKLEGAWMLEV